MKTPDALNMLAMMADAEARSTAQLVEMIAMAVMVKLAPEQRELELSQADISNAMQDYFVHASYDEHGTMTLRLERPVPLSSEVTSEGVDNRRD